MLYDDQPWSRDQLSQDEAAIKKEKAALKRECYRPFVPEPVKSDQWMFDQRQGYADLLVKNGNDLDAKAREYACILLRGFNGLDEPSEKE
jgi:hypothetical protein